MSEYVQFIKRIGLVGITNILISLSGLIFIPIITKSFSTSDYGVWAQVTTTIALIPNLVNLGLPYTMVRFLSPEKDKTKIKDSFFSMMLLVLISSLIMVILMLCGSELIANSLFNGKIQILYAVVIISFFACLNLMLLSFFRTFQQIKLYSLFLVLQTYLGVAVCIFLTLNKEPIETVVWGLLVGYFGVFIAMNIIILIFLGKGIPKLKNLKEELKFAIPTIPSNVSSWVVDSSDKYVIGIILGSTFVGYYSPGYALGSILLMFLSPFALLLPAILPKYYDAGNISKVNTFLKYSMKYYLILTIPAAIGMSILSKELLLILTTSEIAMQGYLITPFVCLGALFMGIYGIINNFIILEKKTKILGHIWILVAIFNIIFNIIAVPYLGIIGAAIVTLICYFFAFLVTATYSRKRFKLPFDIKDMSKIIISSVIMGIFVKIANPSGILNILIVILIAVVIYFVLLFLLKGIDKKEVDIFKEMI
ncbi:oligosaccharide flippase family protein [Methanobrevibacter sp. OttesenSCG-928-K11]|nr:oligosaccharide flippase family protein [Methanobrevibacter sp. OttesenSCG-928-K11]MDL2271192.1 oligosaccharide flippase family protein [Methanobrevibacter sp. OttesenSCG-928-I08]